MADYTLSAKGTYDGSNFNRGLKSSVQALDEFAGKFSKTMSNIAKALVSIEAIRTVATAVSATLNSFAQFEQLVGGVETLFKESSGQLQAYADKAYKTAGMSANEYMSTATSFSASLLQSLGGDTAKAVEYANQAITDMSDNANKMGSDISMIQNAYQGFAKQNYTMLDNLKLGYGGTKEEMERLLADAEKLSGIEYDISSYADIVDAIHVVQTEMGITGTTAEEAAKTVEGSVNAMKAAWQNWLTGLARENVNLNELTAQLMESVAIAAGNVLPRIGQIASSMGEVFATNLSKMRTALPDLFDYIQTVITSSLSSIAAALPQVINDALSLLLFLGQQILELVPQILPSVFQAGVSLFQGLIDAIPTVTRGLVNAVTGTVTQIVTMLPSFLPTIFAAALALFTGIVDAVPQIIPSLTSGIMGVIYLVVSLLPTLVPMLLESATTLFLAIVDSLPVILPQLIDAVLSAIERVSQYLPTLLPMIFSAAVTLFMGLVSAVPQILGSLLSAVGSLISQIPGKITSFVGAIRQAGYDLIAGMVSGITSAGGAVWNAITNICSNSLGAIKSFFGIASPSKVMRKLFNFVGKGMALGLSDQASNVVRTMSGIASDIADASYVSIGAPVFAVAGAGQTGNVAYSMGRADSGAASSVTNYYQTTIEVEANSLSEINSVEHLIEVLEIDA